MLASERRRVVLDVLAGRSTPVDLEELATDVATREIDGETPRVDVVEQVAIALHHNHLPMLTDLGVLEYVPAARRIEPLSVTGDRFQ